MFLLSLATFWANFSAQNTAFEEGVVLHQQSA